MVQSFEELHKHLNKYYKHVVCLACVWRWVEVGSEEANLKFQRLNLGYSGLFFLAFDTFEVLFGKSKVESRACPKRHC